MRRTAALAGTAAILWTTGLWATGAAAQMAPAVAPRAATGAAIPVGTATASSWQSVGSDIPVDTAWRTGTLANGLRYAVRRNALPANSLAIRVRMDVGGLMEADAERGWAHLFEHMAFRGTRHYADGEGVKVWQRLGASFGSDTNAFTSLTSTLFVLDLPRADTASYREAMTVLAEMLQSARIDGPLLDTERQVVLAEGAARRTPLARKLEAADQATMLAGLKAAGRDVLGTPETLAAATPARLHAFYKRWYRPSRAVVVVAGDADPAALEAMVKASFADWQGEGPEPAEPDYGTPRTPAQPIASVVDPDATASDRVVWVTPHDDGPFTVARQQRQNLELIADAVLRQRIATAVQASAALVNAGAGRAERRHVDDQFTIGVIAGPGQRAAALDQVFAVVNNLRANPPSTAEVDQQFVSYRRALGNRLLALQTAPSGELANDFVGDVDHHDVSGDPAFYRDLLTAQKPAITPAAVQRVLADTFAPEPRMLRLATDAATAATAAADLAAARATAAAKDVAIRAVSISELALPATPGTVASHAAIADLGIERVRFANGVTLDWKRTAYERNTIRLTVKIGHGLLARAPNDPGLFWTSGALGAAGIGPFTRDELTRVSAGRRIGFGIGMGRDGLRFATATSRDDLGDALRLMAGGLTAMRYADQPIGRLRDGLAVSYQSLYGQPGSVLAVLGLPKIYGEDTRFRALPPPAEIAALTPAAFRDFWTEQLAHGPIRVEAVGDIDPDTLIAAVGRTLGALPPRTDTPPAAASLAVTVRRPAGGDVVVLHHRGDPDQASMVRVYPTLGGMEDLRATRALGLAASLIETRLLEEFREQHAGSYAPSASTATSNDLPRFGALLVGAQLRPARIADFNAAIDRAVADLAANGPSPDALMRAKTTAIERIRRAQSDNGYWAGVLDENLDDPRRLDAVRTSISGREALDAAAVKEVVARYLTRGGSFTISALPAVAAKPGAAAPAAPVPPAASPRR